MGGLKVILGGCNIITKADTPKGDGVGLIRGGGLLENFTFRGGLIREKDLIELLW